MLLPKKKKKKCNDSGKKVLRHLTKEWTTLYFHHCQISSNQRKKGLKNRVPKGAINSPFRYIFVKCIPKQILKNQTTR